MGTPEEGLSLARTLRPHVILTDLFPEIDGVSFTARLRAALPYARIEPIDDIGFTQLFGPRRAATARALQQEMTVAGCG